jgi:hypothetical protein
MLLPHDRFGAKDFYRASHFASSFFFTHQSSFNIYSCTGEINTTETRNMKLDATVMRTMSRQDYRVLEATEEGMQTGESNLMSDSLL